MKRSHLSIAQKVVGIVVLVFVLNLFCGIYVIYKLQMSNLEYIYQLTAHQLQRSIDEIDEELQRIEYLLYQLIVADEVQTAGSVLLDTEGGEISPFIRAREINTITEFIQKEIHKNPYIVCANFIDAGGEARIIASTRYDKVSPQLQAQISAALSHAGGRAMLFSGDEALRKEQLLLFAQELREKKAMSFRHMGSIVLFVDLEKLVGALKLQTDSILRLRLGGHLEYLLNAGDSGFDAPSLRIEGEKGYRIARVRRQKYFVVEENKRGSFIQTALFLPYNELFHKVSRTFEQYIAVFIVAGMLLVWAGTGLAGLITRELKLFIRRISGIPRANLPRLPLIEEHITDRDVAALQDSFNSMSVYINELIKDNYQKQLLVREAQLKALQSQMNPHFLYNTLNSLYWMVKSRGMSDAAEMVSSFGILLREAINNKELLITVEKEMDIVNHYFLIQKYRYGERLAVKFYIDERCNRLLIPKFCIQPLAENAIVYGLESMFQRCRIEVNIFMKNGDCVCQVKNEGPCPEENLLEKLERGELQSRGNGIGILNINQRVQAIYGQACGVRVFRRGKWTVAEVNFGSRSSAPDSTPGSAPNSASDSAPGSTSDSAPDSASGGTPGSTLDSAPDGAAEFPWRLLKRTEEEA